MTLMVSFDNDWTILFRRPISGAVMVLALVALFWPIVRAALRRIRAAKAPPGIARTQI
jgi:TctA family transporter